MSSYLGSLWKMFVFLWDLSPLWLPILTGIIAWELWVEYARAMFAASKPKVLLEILLPQEITKSPLAMELVLTALHITARESTWIDRYIKGSSRPQFSLELVSIDGKVHFYIYTEKDMRSIIETQIYAQFPSVEVREVEDYTKGIVYQPGITQVWGCEFVKTNVDALPIKTYPLYGLDKDPKEEFKIDPITATLEYLGSTKQGENVWIQILVRAHKKESVVYVKGKRKKVDWQHFAEEQKKKLLDSLKDKDIPGSPARRLTKSEEDVLAAIDRSVSKLPFDVGIRGIYFAPKEVFSAGTRAGLIGSVRQYNSNNMNGFKPNNGTSFDYPWQDFHNIRLDARKKKMLNSYKQRNYFGMGDRKQMVMNTEELATLYHFPGGVAATPTFARIMSKKAQAPANLPI